MPVEMNFRDLFLNQLCGIYDAELQLIQALPKMAQAATTLALKTAFVGNLVAKKGHSARLEEIFKNLDEKPAGKTCVAMKGLITEGHDIASAKYAPAVRDAGLITAAQRVEHYEMAVYGFVHAFALLLDDDRIAGLLKQTLTEEGDCNKELTKIAQSAVNKQAYAQAAAFDDASR